MHTGIDNFCLDIHVVRLLSNQADCFNLPLLGARLISAEKGAAMPNHTDTSPLSPADNPGVIAHVNLLQGVINRLANNSSSCKTWCLTLTGALLSLAGATHQPAIATFAPVPIVIFGLLDARYLAHERSYRELYTQIVQKVRDGTYARSDAFEAAAPLNGCGICSALLSWSVIPIYGGLLLAYAIAAYEGWIALLAAGK